MHQANAQLFDWRFVDVEITILTPEYLSFHPTPGYIPYTYSVKNLGPDTLCDSDSFYLKFLTNRSNTPENRVAVGRTLLPGDSIIYNDSVYFNETKNRRVLFGQLVSLYQSHLGLCEKKLISETDSFLDNNTYFTTINLYYVANVPKLNTIQLSVFPNPNASGYFYIKSNYKMGQVKVWDTRGNLLLHEDKLHTNEKAIDLSYYAPGIYILQAQTTEGTINKKIIRL